MEPEKLKIVKAKDWVTSINPNGLSIDFKLVNGCKFVCLNDWSKWKEGNRDEKDVTVSSSSSRFFRFLEKIGFPKGKGDDFGYEGGKSIAPKTSEPSQYNKMIRWLTKFLEV